MPIEIREVIIRAEVRRRDVPTNTIANNSSATNEKSIVRACVEQVMQILRDKEER